MTLIRTGICAAGLLLWSSVATAEELSLSHFMSPNHPYHEMIFEHWAEQVAEATDGEITIRVYPAGELGQGPAQQYSRAIDGVSDIAFIVQGYTPGDVFPLTLIAEQPGAIVATDDITASMNQANELLADEYRRVVPLAIWGMPPAVLFTRDREVRSLADMAGMKVRAPTREGGELIAAWGATPVFLPATDVYSAMQTGVVDAVLINASAAVAFNLAEVSTYMITGFESLPPIFGLIMNRDAYDALPDAAREAFDAVSHEALAAHAGAVSNRITAYGMSQFLERDGNSHIELSAEAAAEFSQAAAPILETYIAELEAQGQPALAVLAAMRGE